MEDKFTDFVYLFHFEIMKVENYDIQVVYQLIIIIQ